MAALYPRPEFLFLWHTWFRLHRAKSLNYEAFAAYMRARMPAIFLLVAGLALFFYYAVYLPLCEAVHAYQLGLSHDWGMVAVHFSIIILAKCVFSYTLYRMIKAESRMLHVVNEGLVAEKYTLSADGTTCMFYDHVGMPHEFTLPKAVAAYAAHNVQNAFGGNAAKTENSVRFLKQNPNHAVFYIPRLHRMFHWKKS